MSSKSPQRGSQRLNLSLDAREAGTLLGTVAWVLGALEIMKDRGHAERDEKWHELYDTLTPRLNDLLAKVTGARSAAGDEAMQRQIEEAYTPVREAFEAWISLTASDTFSVAVGQRLAERMDAAEGDGEEPSASEQGETAPS